MANLPPTEIHPKVQAVGVAGAITVVIVWVASMLGVDVPGEVASAFTIIISFLAGYLKSSGDADLTHR